MSEIVTSPMNKNTLLYGSAVPMKNDGPACVDRKGEFVNCMQFTPTAALVKAVREK